MLPGAALSCPAVRKGHFRRPTANMFQVLNCRGRVQTAGGFFTSEGSGAEAKAVDSKVSCAHGLASTGDSDSARACLSTFFSMEKVRSKTKTPI